MELQWCDLPIFVLRMHVDGNEKMLTSETFPILSYDHQDELDELKKMADSDAKTIKDMYYYACENGIKELLDLKEEAYLKMEKKSFYEGMVSHSIHERYRKTLDELGKDKSIVVSYQGLPGFSRRSYSIDEDFRVEFSTNIGYGSYSYFLVFLSYKNIPIEVAPAFSWNTKRPDVIKNWATGKYDGQYLAAGFARGVLDMSPNYDSCKKAMDAIAELYNMLVKNIEYKVQALVLDADTSRMISSKYWASDIYKM